MNFVEFVFGHIFPKFRYFPNGIKCSLSPGYKVVNDILLVYILNFWNFCSFRIGHKSTFGKNEMVNCEV